MTIIAILGTLSAPAYYSFQVRNDLDVARDVLTQSLRRAQVLARASDGDTSWGVAIAAGQVTLFKGVSYPSRDTDYDESYGLPVHIRTSGRSEVVYAKFSGLPNLAGQTNDVITLTSGANELRAVTINAQGLVY